MTKTNKFVTPAKAGAQTIGLLGSCLRGNDKAVFFY